jgi:RNA polymerase sigma-70 factor (ECF subfamily)
MSNPKAPLVSAQNMHLPTAVSAESQVSIQDIEALMMAHYASVRRLALSILNDAAEADDAAQETFLAASRAADDFRGQASPKTWLTAIAVNVCRGRLRKLGIRRRLQSVLESLHLATGSEASPERAALQGDADRRIWQAVDSLDEKHRLVVILRYVHDLNADEIAAALRTSQGTVYSRLHYARQRLRDLLDNPASPGDNFDGTP